MRRSPPRSPLFPYPPLFEPVRNNPRTFRLFGPDETASNRLQAVFETTDRTWNTGLVEGDDHLAPDGRVMEVLSEHLCQGWLERSEEHTSELQSRQSRMPSSA